MDIGDVVRIAFLLLIVAGFVLPRARPPATRHMEQSRRDTPSGPKALSESGGYRLPSQPGVRGATAVRPAGDRSTGRQNTPATELAAAGGRHRLQAVLEALPSSASNPTAEERARPPVITPPARHARRGLGSMQVRQQLGRPGSLRLAFVMKEVLDRPVGMREGR